MILEKSLMVIRSGPQGALFGAVGFLTVRAAGLTVFGEKTVVLVAEVLRW